MVGNDGTGPLGSGGVFVPLAQEVEIGHVGRTQDEDEAHGKEHQGREGDEQTAFRLMGHEAIIILDGREARQGKGLGARWTMADLRAGGLWL